MNYSQTTLKLIGKECSYKSEECESGPNKEICKVNPSSSKLVNNCKLENTTSATLSSSVIPFDKKKIKSK